MTQTERLLDYLRANPGCSSMDIVRDLSIVNTTGRISDLRKEGHDIVATRDRRGVYRFRLVSKPVQLAAFG